MLQTLYSSGGQFATKMEIRIVAKFSTFYGKYGHFPHRFTHFFVVTDVYALFDIPSEKKRSQLYKKEGGGGQRPFINFIKKQTFSYRRTSLSDNDT